MAKKTDREHHVTSIMLLTASLVASVAAILISVSLHQLTYSVKVVKVCTELTGFEGIDCVYKDIKIIDLDYSLANSVLCHSSANTKDSNGDPVCRKEERCDFYHGKPVYEMKLKGPLGPGYKSFVGCTPN